MTGPTTPAELISRIWQNYDLTALWSHTGGNCWAVRVQPDTPSSDGHTPAEEAAHVLITGKHDPFTDLDQPLPRSLRIARYDDPRVDLPVDAITSPEHAAYIAAAMTLTTR